MKTINSKTIVFVTGAFVTNQGWKNWQDYFESKGYTTYAPAWPFKEGSPEELRLKHPNNDRELADLRYQKVVDYYADFIKKLPEQPIIIGHSLGGLTVQLLLQRNLAAAAVAIHSVPPQGVISLEYSFYKSLWNPLGIFSSTKKTYLMSFSDWQYSFTNGMNLEDQKKAYVENAIPESRLALRDPLTAAGKIDFNKPHNPLLFISGSTDHIMPAPLNFRNFKRYKHQNSITRYKEFQGHNHFVLGLPSWREEADYILDFIENN